VAFAAEGVAPMRVVDAPMRGFDAPVRVADAPMRGFDAPMRNHQHFNAEAFASKGAADEGIQSQLTAKQLYIYLMGRYDRPERLAEMAEKMRALATPDAASRVASLVESVAK